MMSRAELTSLLLAAWPDAEVAVQDRTGAGDHFLVRIVADAFRGQSLLDRQRLVYRALNAPLSDGRIHALEIVADTRPNPVQPEGRTS